MNSNEALGNAKASEIIDRLADDFDSAWAAGRRPALADWLAQIAASQSVRLLEVLIPIDIEYRIRAGEPVVAADYLKFGTQFELLVLAALTNMNKAPGATGELIKNALGGTRHGIGSRHLGSGGHVGNYRLVRQLGQGAMGVVWLATHRRFVDRHYAIKLLAPYLVNQESLARFEREMTVQGTLHHPNLVAAIDAGHEDGVPYLVMEYVSGPDLRRIQLAHGLFSIAAACEVLRQVALGMAYAHSRGVVHRDLKPANLLVDSEGRVRIIDLGLASFQSAIELTSAESTLGTYAFMAPEQFRSARSASPASDVYSLGCILYCLITGHPPFCESDEITSAELMHHHLETPPPLLSSSHADVPPELCLLVRECLAKDTSQRPASAGKIAEQLSPYCVDGVALLREMTRNVPLETDPGRLLIQSASLPVSKPWAGQPSTGHQITTSFNLRAWGIIVASLLSVSSISLALAYCGPATTEAWRLRFDRLAAPERFPAGTGFFIELARAFIFVSLTCFVVAHRFGRHCQTFFLGRQRSIKLWSARILVAMLVLLFLFAEGTRQLSLDRAPATLANWAATVGLTTTVEAEAIPYRFYLPYSIVNYVVVFCGLVACPVLAFFLSDRPLLTSEQLLFQARQGTATRPEFALDNLRHFATHCRRLAFPYVEALGALSVGIHFEFWIGRWTLTDAGMQTAVFAWVVLGLTFGFVLFIGKVYSESYAATQEVLSASGSTADELQLFRLNALWFLKTTFLANISGLACLSLGLVAVAALLGKR